ncbi:MAG: sigma-70 family RNA polymerase sigma factor [Hyphomonadaceae bacterium]|nr:sigma-70 family RNA polymerase sigma factor [Hyphomonadaceae bacterium]
MTRNASRVLDEYLVAAAQTGSRPALNGLARRWTPRLLRHARHLLDADAAARDAVQETWLAIVRGLARLDDPAKFPAWAFAIATRKCADQVRANVGLRRARETLAHDPALAESAGENVAPSESAALRRALARLPAEQRVVVAMFYADELTIEEIAAALTLPAGTVKSRLFNARKALKQMLGKEAR